MRTIPIHRLSRVILWAMLAMSLYGTGVADTPSRTAKNSSASEATRRLIVKVCGLRNDCGEIQIALFHDAKGFPDSDADATARQSIRIAPGSGGMTTITFTDLKPGEYAVALFHDENDNGILDTSLGFPLEGFGTSNDPKLHWRAPTYSESKFVIERDHSSGSGGDAVITIHIRYLTE